MPLSRRERVRAATIDEIKEIARQHMAEKGAAALSLRAIAREMGMTSPALYRYFASRDALVTALIIDAYNAFADALEAARDAYAADDHAGRLINIGYAYRHWALAFPQQYSLIFGTPIPGYEAPTEITRPVAARSMTIFLNALHDAERSGHVDCAEIEIDFSAAVQTQLQPWIESLNFQGNPKLLYLAISHWGMIHGLVTLEIFGHLDTHLPQEMSGAFFEAEVRALVKRLKLK